MLQSMNDNDNAYNSNSPQMHSNGINPGTGNPLEEMLSRPVNNESLQLVLGYLRRNGFTETEENLTREAGPILRSESSSGLPPELVTERFVIV